MKFDVHTGEVAEANAAPQATAEGPHPLEHKWTFWEHKAAEKKTMSKKEWGELQRKLFTFDTVEEFWGTWETFRRDGLGLDDTRMDAFHDAMLA